MIDIVLRVTDEVRFDPEGTPFKGTVETTKSIVLTIETLAPVTPEGAKSKTYGNWRCPSPYIGYHNNGKYYVANILPSQAEAWSLGGGVVDMNPVCFLFDSFWDDPFLILYKCSPMGPSYTRGAGLLRHLFWRQNAGQEVPWYLRLAYKWPPSDLSHDQPGFVQGEGRGDR